MKSLNESESIKGTISSWLLNQFSDSIYIFLFTHANPFNKPIKSLAMNKNMRDGFKTFEIITFGLSEYNYYFREK